MNISLDYLSLSCANSINHGENRNTLKIYSLIVFLLYSPFFTFKFKNNEEILILDQKCIFLLMKCEFTKKTVVT